MINADITILMAIHNKNECLNNTLHSIKHQKTSFKYNVCFIDHNSICSPLPIIKTYFQENEFCLNYVSSNIGFQHIRQEFLKMIPEKTQIIIWQSCDVIWKSTNLLENMICKMKTSKYRYKQSVYKNIIVVPEILYNLEISPDLYESCDFHKQIDNVKNNINLRGHNQNPGYLFLGCLKKETFQKAVTTQIYNSSGVCDIIMKECLYNTMNLELVRARGEAVHQKHDAVIAECTSINECSHPCKIRRKLLARGVKFPHYIGNYNFNRKKFEI